MVQSFKKCRGDVGVYIHQPELYPIADDPTPTACLTPTAHLLAGRPVRYDCSGTRHGMKSFLALSPMR